MNWPAADDDAKAIMEFRILGPVEVWSAGQQRDLGSARERYVLAILCLTPRIIVPSAAIIDRIWGAAPPRKARESLSVYVARLRGSLREALPGEAVLAGRASGYELRVDPETVDLYQFRRLRRQADALAAGGDADHAASLLREADQLWRGPALTGISGDWVERMRDSLEEERRAARLKRIECDLDVGRHADLLSELGNLLAQYPLDEGLIGCQMTALYRSGRAAEALSLYRDTRSRLIDEQGTEPGPALSGLHQLILGNDPQLAAPPAVRRPGGVAAETVPPGAADFVGRREELGRISGEAGSTSRVTVIEGMAGVGKTALALHAARAQAAAYPDGIYYLNFHTHDPGCPSLDAEQAAHRLLRMLSSPAGPVPDSPADRAALLRAQLARRRTIIILDDAARAEQVRPILELSGDCLILITTRRRLAGLEDANTLTLDVLPADDAVTLFQRVAGSLGHDREEAAMAVELCGRLPLAIQLAAGRAAHDYRPNLATLVGELSQPAGSIDRTGMVSPEVMSAFDVSYQSLEPDQQRFFRQLGLSPCACLSVHAAAALSDGTVAETEAALSVLQDHHLLDRAPSGQFRFHDLIREYAALRARREDSRAEQRRAVGRLLDYYLHTADRADRIVHPFRHRPPPAAAQLATASLELASQDDAAAWLEAEWRNVLQAAYHAGRHEWKGTCADLIHALAGFLEVRAYWDEALEAHTAALLACRELDDAGRIAQAALELCQVSRETGRREDALALGEESAAIFRTLGDPRGEAAALDEVAKTQILAGHSREALAYIAEAGSLCRGAGDSHGVAEALSHSGVASWQLGRSAEAMEALRGALSLYQAAGDRRGEAKTLNNLGRMHLYLGYHRDALQCYLGALATYREIGGPQSEAIVYHNIGNVYQYKGSYEEALAAYRRALAIYRDIGDLPDEASVLNDVGAAYLAAECYDEALVYHQKAQAIAEEIGNLPQQAVALRGIAAVRRGHGQPGEAFDHYQAALKLAREIGDPYEEAKTLEGIAETTLSTRRTGAGRIQLRQALDLYDRLGVPEAGWARIRLEALDLAGPGPADPGLRPAAGGWPPPGRSSMPSAAAPAAIPRGGEDTP